MHNNILYYTTDAISQTKLSVCEKAYLSMHNNILLLYDWCYFQTKLSVCEKL